MIFYLSLLYIFDYNFIYQILEQRFFGVSLNLSTRLFQRKSLKGMSDWFAKPVMWVQFPPFPLHFYYLTSFNTLEI